MRGRVEVDGVIQAVDECGGEADIRVARKVGFEGNRDPGSTFEYTTTFFMARPIFVLTS